MKRTITALTFFSVVLLCLFVFSSSTAAQSVSVDFQHSKCLWDNMGQPTIIPNAPVTYAIRLENNTGETVMAMTNGFKISSPTPFTPIGGYLNPAYDEGFLFDIERIILFGADGIGEDTIAFEFLRLASGEGMVDGFNDIVYYITTGGVPNGETLCLDSSRYPPVGVWRWSNTIPTWGGPYCLESITPPVLVYIDNCPTTLDITTCGDLTYLLNVNEGCPEYQSCSIVSGPGSIGDNGLYSYTYNPDHEGTTQTVTINMNSGTECCFDYDLSCTFDVNVSITDFRTPGDINTDCVSDIEDLVFYIDYQFRDGEAPPVFMLADCNADGVLDIEDLVYLVDYQFRGGPAPIVLW